MGKVVASLQNLSKEDVTALLNGKKDEPSSQRSQVADGIVDTLVTKTQHVQQRHHVTFTWRYQNQ